MDEPRNIAARAGRWSAQHRKKAIFGWLAFVIVAFQLGGMVGTQTLDVEESGVGDSGRADTITSDAFPKKSEEQVLVQSKSGGVKADDPAFRAGVADVIARLEGRSTSGRSRAPMPARARGASRPTGAPRSSPSRSPGTAIRARSG